jgi:hypothetical protein
MMDPMDQLEAARSGAIATPVAGSSSSPVGSRLQSAMGATGQPAPPGLRRVGDHLAFPTEGNPSPTPIVGMSQKAPPTPPSDDDVDAPPEPDDQPPDDDDDAGDRDLPE